MAKKMTQISATELRKLQNKLAAVEKRKAKQAASKVDGLSARDIAKIRAAIRQVWHRSHVRKLVVKRCTGPDGFAYCEQCFEPAPALKIDHVEKVGDVDGGFIERLFCASKYLQGLCKSCHDAKTREERKAVSKSRR